MPSFEVDLYEGNELVTYDVEAADEEEAKQKALAFREEVFRAETSREGLQREKEMIEQKMQDAPGKLEAGLLGLGEGTSHVVRGAVDSVLNAAEGVATLFRAQGGAGVQQTINQARQTNMEGAVELATNVHARVAGRPLTEAEKGKVVEDTEKFVKRGKFATDAALGIAGGVATMAARTVPRMLALGAAEGGLGGYLMADTSSTQTVDEGAQKRLGEAKVGAVLGAGLSVAPATLVWAKNWLGRRVVRAGGGQEAVDTARQNLGRLGIYEVDPYQLTGDPRIGVAVTEAAGGQAQQMFREQADAAVKGLARQAGIEMPPTASLLEGSAESVSNVMNLTQKALGTMRGARNKAFQGSLNAIAETTGDAPVIPVGRFMDGLLELTKEMGEQYGASFKTSSLFNDTYRDILKAASTGGLDAKQANAILTRLNGMQQTGRGIVDFGQEAVTGQEGRFIGYSKIKAKELKDLFLKSLDDAAETMPGETGQQLKNARARYAQDSARIQTFEDSWKNSVGMSRNPGVMLKQLEAADPTSARQFVAGLRQMQGGQEVIDSMNEYMFREAARKASAAMVDKGSKRGDFNMGVFMKELSASTKASRLRGMLSAEQEKNLVKGMNNLRLLQNNEQFAQGVYKTHLMVDLQHIAINAISRDPGFMARVLAGAIQTGSGAEALFFTKAGQDVLYNATRFALRAPKTAAAIQSANATVAYLLSMQGAGEQLRQIGELMPDE